MQGIFQNFTSSLKYIRSLYKMYFSKREGSAFHLEGGRQSKRKPKAYSFHRRARRAKAWKILTGTYTSKYKS